MLSKRVNALLFMTICVCAVSILTVHGQKNYMHESNDFVITQEIISVEQGLTSRDVKDAVMDARGFMWLATDMGLNRYDGREVIIFTKESHGLLSNNIINLTFDSRHNRLILKFYLGSDPNVGHNNSSVRCQVMDLSSFKVFSVAEAFPGLPFPENQVELACEQGRGELMFLRREPCELWKYSADKSWRRIGLLSKWEREDLDFNNLLYSSIVQDDELLLNPISGWNIPAYRKEGDVVVPVNFEKQGRFLNSADEDLYIYYDPSPNHSTLHRDERERGFYLVGDQNGWTRSAKMGELPSISFRDWQIQKSNVPGEYACVNADFGLYLFKDGSYLNVITQDQLMQLSDIFIHTVFHDDEDNYWLCTTIGLIHVFVRERIFSNHFTKEEFGDADINQVRGIYVEANGSVDGGDQIYANVWKKIATYPPLEWEVGKEGYSLMPIAEHGNSLYFGEFYTVRKGTGEIIRTDFDSESSTAWALFSVNDSLLLRGVSDTIGGIYVINTQTGKSRMAKRLVRGIPNPTILYRFITTQKKGIVAVAENGIFRLDSDLNIAEYWGPEGNENHLLNIHSFYDLHEDKAGVCWIATSSQGLFRWEWNALTEAKQPKLRQFGLSEGLPSMRLYRIEEDEGENLWVSTYNGLMRFDKKNLSVVNFTTADGLSHNEFNRISSFKASDGKMYFGGVNGLNSFNPKEVDGVFFNQSYPLQVLSIQRFSDESDSLVNMLVDWYTLGAITISHADRFLDFDFALLDYAQRSHRYAYMLEGIDTDWIFTENGSLRMNQLPYGTYTLHIKAMLENGQWNASELHIPIVVISPVYMHWEFWLPIILVLALSVWLYNYWRTKKLERSNEYLEKIVTERTEKLSSALKDRELLLQEIHHRVKNNLQIVTDLLQLQKDEMKDADQMSYISDGQSRVVSIALIHQNLYQHHDLSSVRFDTFINSLIQQIVELHNANGRTISVEHKCGDFFLDIDTAIPLGLITNELITNSYKYAYNDQNEVKIEVELVELEKGMFKMTFRDFGLGLPEGVDVQKSPSLGMHLINGLTHQLSGDVRYWYEGGSFFEVTFYNSERRSLQ
jgi:two-component sensor histidine kinase